MSEHQETLDQAVKRIEASFAKIKTYGKKVEDFRSSAGKQLVELKARIEAGEDGEGVNWWKWYAEHFKNRTRRDAQKVMALARSDDPEAAAEEEREKNREAKALQRKRETDERPQPGATSDGQTWNEEDVAAAVVRDIEHELAARESDGLDLDLVRELIMQKLKFAWVSESVEESADARKALYDETETPEETPAMPIPAEAEGNGVDVDTSAETMKSAFTELAADLSDALSGPPKRVRGRPPGSKNKSKAA